MQPLAHDFDEKQRTEDVILEENVHFDSLLLPKSILEGLAASGFVKPSPIQFKAIPLGRCGFDLVVKSKAGTGKTLVFSTIALETVDVAKEQLQALILVPTREIAVQIQDVLRGISCGINGLVVESFIGGMPLDVDIKKTQMCHVAVGAPGRVKHLIRLEALSTKSVRLFVIDEADKLMESSFQADINEIYNALPRRKQMIASSATYPDSLDKFLANYMISPTHVTSENHSPLLLGLKQFVAILKPNLNSVQQNRTKNELLVDVLSKICFTQCLVFTNYQSRTETISNYLNQKGWNSCFISAAQEQARRLEAVNNLKNFKNRILLSTDLTSRGIDAPNVDLVVNYDLPQNAVTYLHRMGRAGRFGSSGVCINFALEGDELKRLQLILGTIGSTNLSMAKLPPLHGRNDLNLMDEGQWERVWGLVPSAPAEIVESKDIKKEVLALKTVKIEQSEVKDVVNDVLEAAIDDTDSEDADCKKRKRDSSEQTNKFSKTGGRSHDQDDHKKSKPNSGNQTPNDTFVKNTALLSATKLLLDPNVNIDRELVTSIEKYLANLKQLNPETKTVEEVLVASSEDFLEDIFRVAYKCALQKHDRSWMDYLSGAEKKWFEDSCRATSDDEDLEIEDEDEEEFSQEDMEVEAYEDEVAERADLEEQTNLQWVPVVPNQSPNEDYFVKCYEDCSNDLWNTGLTFESVSDFDCWFYNWREQLQAVRSYVQQNVYVEEMSKFQQSRRIHK